MVDFHKIRLAYKGSELVKEQEIRSGPAFKRIYQLFGASYPGEYLRPKKEKKNKKQSGGTCGTYVLSWTGIAFTFEIQHSDVVEDIDHVSLLSSSAASPAMQMALFEGTNWPEASTELFVRAPNGPRLPALVNKPKDNLPAEIELASILGDGIIQISRRAPAAMFSIVLNETTPQDLITELGAPEAMHKQQTGCATPEQTSQNRRSSTSRPISNGRTASASQPSSYSSTGTDTFDTDFDSGDADEDPVERAGRETFWCYFSHGMDILVGPARDSPSSDRSGEKAPLTANSHLVVTKVIIHGNIPGSYAFNRHRRLRWTISLPNIEDSSSLNSEGKFDDLAQTFAHSFKEAWPATEMSKGKVVNRTWGAGTSDSSFFLPDAGQDLTEGGNSEQWLGNTRLYTFPGLVFEVLQGGVVAALTVY